MNKEIEIKISLDKNMLNDTKKWLRKNAKYQKTIKQTDSYFNNPERPFIFTKEDGVKDAIEYLRVRETNKKSYLCFKKVHRDEKTQMPNYCDEYETVISDPDATKKLLESLGYKEKTVLHKTRTTYLFKNFEIALDQVENLGNFMEIELKEEVPNFKIGHQMINNCLKLMEFKKVKIQQQGYVRMLWNKNCDFSICRNIF
jgi:adenylate cyclase class 2